ncbi:MAG: C39 family peptidase [Vulcanimicrobiaceae bacterium]
MRVSTVPGIFRSSVMSVRERDFDGIVKQQTDFSCGAAVIATLFRDGFGAPVGESDVLQGMLNYTDPALVRSRGFSLLDIKNYAKIVGLSSEGYEIDLAQLQKLRVPAIVLLNVGGYHHFAIIRRADERFAYVADPALGYRRLTLGDFAAEWNGIVLVVAGAGYRPDNVLSRIVPPLTARDLYGTAPVAPTPQAEALVRFDGLPPVQRL